MLTCQCNPRFLDELHYINLQMIQLVRHDLLRKILIDSGRP